MITIVLRLICLARVRLVSGHIEASTTLTFKFYQPRRIFPVPLHIIRRQRLDPLFRRRLVLGDNLLGLLLLLLQEVADPLEDVAGQDETGGDDRLATGHDSLTATLLVFVAVGLERPVLGVVRGVERPVDVRDQRILNLLGLGLDKGDALVELAQELVTQLVRLGHVRLRIGRGGLKVWQGRLDEFRVAGVGEVDGLGSVRVLLDRLDRVGH